ncbi:hypothetical protein ACFQH8_02900 [Halomicroarcula sp. GCM10025710]
MFERDPRKITAAIPADIPSDWGFPSRRASATPAALRRPRRNTTTTSTRSSTRGLPTTRRCRWPTTSRRWPSACSPSSA